MRVVQVIHSLRKGGAERVALELALGFSERGISNGIVSLLDVNEYDEPRYSRVAVRSLIPASQYSWPGCVPKLASNLKRVLAELNPGVIELHTPTAAIVAGFASLKVPSAQVFHCPPRVDSFKNRIFRALERWAYWRLKYRPITVSESLVPFVAAHIRCRPSAVKVVHNGVDRDLFRYCERPLPPSTDICVIGTLADKKRPQDAVRAFHLLQQQLPAARLQLIGDGDLRESLQGMIDSLGLHDSALLLGRRDDVPQLLAHSAVLWMLSSADSEGLPMVCIEAMAMGVPVIGTEVIGVRDAVGARKMLVGVGDVQATAEKTRKLLTDPVGYRRASKYAHERAASLFSLDSMIDGHLDALLQSDRLPAAVVELDS